MLAGALSRLLILCTVSVIAVSCLSAAPSVVVDGKVLRCPAPPVRGGGALLLPMRPVFEALHARLQWLPRERKLQARRGETLVELWIGTPVAQVNRNPYQLDAPPALIDGVAYVPLRFVAEALGGLVRWDELTQTAFVYSTR